MFSKVARDLLLANALVFLCVLTIFSFAVYSYVLQNLHADVEERLTVLSDALIKTFDFEDNEDAAEPEIPEILRPHIRDVPLSGVSLQWYGTGQKLIVQNGVLPMTAEFRPVKQCQEQANPHCLILTTPVMHDQKLTGYLRTGISLGGFDSFRNQLLQGLVWGTLAALSAAAVGILWLVKQSLKPVEKSIEKLTQFTGDASHELRNPLMAVKTNAAVALRHADGMRNGDKEKFEVILDATNQMITTTTDLLHLAQSDANLQWHDVASLNLDKLISTLISEMTPEAQAKSVSLRANVSDDITVTGREDDMRLVFGNTIQNAIQYTKENGTVVIEANKQGKRIVTKIIDDGIGISAEELPKIYDRFWRSDKARTHRSGGNGLGLSIVRATLERYEGSIEVTSELGKGTAVTVSLPAGG